MSVCRVGGEPIPWADWFAKFDAADLASVCQEQQADGSPSTFNKPVRR